MSLLRKIVVGLLLLVMALFSITCVAVKVLGASVPTGGVRGPEAEALARAVQAKVDVAAWERTGAVQWTFFDRNTHLWDRQRMLVEVRTGERRILLDLTTQQGLAWDGDAPLAGQELAGALRYAWVSWANDSFWLNPLPKLFDEGVVLEKIATPDDPDGAQGLLASYTKGGVTPGDRYLWILDAQGQPIAWRMWTAVFPVAGIRVSWDDWITLSTGARVATRHDIAGGLKVTLTGVRGAATLAELVGDQDPFAPLYQR